MKTTNTEIFMSLGLIIFGVIAFISVNQNSINTGHIFTYLSVVMVLLGIYVAVRDKKVKKK